MEHNSEKVEIGKIIHETSYQRKKKEIELDGIKIDFFDKNRGVIHEVKKSRAMEESHIWQLKYYILCFKKLGLDVTGEINYPVFRKIEKVKISNSDELFLEEIIQKITNIVNQEIPKISVSKANCKECSYYELCYI